MLMGHTDGISERGSTLGDRESNLAGTGDASEDQSGELCSEEVLHEATFDELAANSLKYDTIIWVSISLLLVLAWGVGIIMLLYLPIRRYVIQRDISSRKLYVTPNDIVYKVSRPSFVPFWGVATIEKRVPLSMVIDIIIEQGCLQAVYGIHTVRVESIAQGKAAPVDELQVQGVDDPTDLRKIIITEAAKSIQEAGKGMKSFAHTADGDSVSRAGSLSEGPAYFKSPSKSWKISGSPRYASTEPRSTVPAELLLNRIEEVQKSMKRIESLMGKSNASTDSVAEN